jgi:hypothetical protein
MKVVLNGTCVSIKQLITTRNLDNTPLECSAVRTGLTEAARNDDGPAHPAPSTSFQRLRHNRRRHDDDDQIDRIGRRFNRGVTPLAQDLIGFGIDEVNGARIA